MLTNTIFSPRGCSAALPRIYCDDTDLPAGRPDEAEQSCKLSDEENDDNEVIKKYGLDAYENEECGWTGGIDDLMTYKHNKDDPYMTNLNPDEEELEDFLIRPTDHVLLTTLTEEEFSYLNVCILPEGSIEPYIHHDYLLSDFPLSIAWMRPNYCAVATFQPQIEIWDLDVVESPSPIRTLEGHNSSVLDVSMHHTLPTLLASGSADRTVGLWDTEQGKRVQTLSHHQDKVQCLSWLKTEESVLATGGFDKAAYMVDVRCASAVKKVDLDADVECLKWSTESNSPVNHAPSRGSELLISTESGHLYCYDAVAGKNRWTLASYLGSPCASFCIQSFEDFTILATASPITTAPLKIWALNQNLDAPTCLYSGADILGKLYKVEMNQDLPFHVAVGGHRILPTMINVLHWNSVRQKFKHSSAAQAVDLERAAHWEDLLNVLSDDDSTGDESERHPRFSASKKRRQVNKPNKRKV
ncbi:uncharacterized protein LOC126332407 [Schistocerca gregaria]|uniref:uncharacterized protein LOC126332407 n=1 Tax=Schistocerca gregaria TaxID=7010 RepID=UPI00211E27B0|nr:uncharacterized protein LOC126332407 [Schistocerca gregaria]